MVTAVIIGMISLHCNSGFDKFDEGHRGPRSIWNAWSDCSVTCGQGFMTRERNCTVGWCPHNNVPQKTDCLLPMCEEEVIARRRKILALTLGIIIPLFAILTVTLVTIKCQRKKVEKQLELEAELQLKEKKARQREYAIKMREHMYSNYDDNFLESGTFRTQLPFGESKSVTRKQSTDRDSNNPYGSSPYDTTVYDDYGEIPKTAPVSKTCIQKPSTSISSCNSITKKTSKTAKQTKPEVSNTQTLRERTSSGIYPREAIEHDSALYK